MAILRLVVSGGLYSKSGSNTATHYHECSQPKESYRPGETASPTMRYFTKSSAPTHYNGGCEINCYAPKGAYFGRPWWGYFKNQSTGEYNLHDRDGYTYGKRPAAGSAACSRAHRAPPKRLAMLELPERLDAHDAGASSLPYS